MAEFMYRGEKITGIDEPITLENNTSANFDVSVGIGIIFRKSGLYRVSVDSKQTSVKIEPERKKGKWLEIDAGYCDYHYVKCSQCGETFDWKKNFCPNCGADMREGEEE